MILKLFRISMFTVFFVGLCIAVRADDFSADVKESRVIRHTNMLSKQYKPLSDDMAQRIQNGKIEMLKLARLARLTSDQRKMIEGENAAYLRALKNLEDIVIGQTSRRDILEWFGLPDEVIDGDSILPVRLKAVSARSSPHFLFDGYPYPRQHQKTLEHTFYLTGREPGMGIKIELLVTVNKQTEKVEDFMYYVSSVPVPQYWKTALITDR